ncbi:hypothetical protein QQ045_011632 [Rhodiola kirilowii]
MPQSYVCYSQCYDNGLKFVVWDRGRKKRTQNSGVMVEDATTGRQVFYLDDLKQGDNWKVVNVASHIGVYSDSSLAREDETEIANAEEDDPYQEDMPTYITSEVQPATQFNSNDDNIDNQIPKARRQLYLD